MLGGCWGCWVLTHALQVLLLVVVAAGAVAAEAGGGVDADPPPAQLRREHPALVHIWGVRG